MAKLWCVLLSDKTVLCVDVPLSTASVADLREAIAHTLRPIVRKKLSPGALTLFLAKKEKEPESEWERDDHASLLRLVQMSAKDLYSEFEGMRPSLPLVPHYFSPDFTAVEGCVHVLVELPAEVREAACPVKQQQQQPPLVDVVVHVERNASERTALLTKPVAPTTLTGAYIVAIVITAAVFGGSVTAVIIALSTSS